MSAMFWADKSWNVEAGNGAGRRGEAESWRGEEEEGVEKKLMFFFSHALFFDRLFDFV